MKVEAVGALPITSEKVWHSLNALKMSKRAAAGEQR